MLLEIQSLGSRTKECIVPNQACSSLDNNGVLSAGITFAHKGYRFIRKYPAMMVILACTKGQGNVLIGGQWQLCNPGMAYLAPPETLHAYDAESEWNFAWVAFKSSQTPVFSLQLTGPMLIPIDPYPLYRIIEQLYQEYTGFNHDVMKHHLSELLVLYCKRILEPWQSADTFQQLWSMVDAKLSYPWKLDELADLAHISSEHLRKQCHQKLGRSPVKHLAYLRMQRATHLLKTTNWTIEDIAYAVGYQDAFAFSTAFKRWIAMTPSAYRTRA